MTIVYKYIATPKFSAVLRHWTRAAMEGVEARQPPSKQPGEFSIHLHIVWQTT